MTTHTQVQIEAAEDPVDGFLNELEYHKQVKPNATATAALQWAYNEIVRLRALTAAAEAGEPYGTQSEIDHLVDQCATLLRENRELEAATIERCAQVADRCTQFEGNKEIAAAIRAMKEKP